MKFDPVQTDYFAFGGGLVQTLPAMKAPPGSLIDVQNYEPDHNGGYRRGPAYERFDGQTRPSAASYQAIACTLTAVLVAGDALTIGAATCRFVSTVTGGMLVTLVSGTIPGSTSITRGGSPVGSTSATATLSYSPTAADEAANLNAAADVARAPIGAVPGEGPVRGVVMFGDTLYAWRNNVGSTACVMHKSSASGWTAVTLAEELVFSNGNNTVVEGATITQGGVSAIIRRVQVETGTLASGTNTGRLVISGRAGGNFGAGATTGAVCTLAGIQTAQSFPANGTYRFDQYNFTGNSANFRLYGANGVGRAFEFDGTYLAFISTGLSPDAPSFVRCHRKYLYLAMKSSVLNSSVGTPYRFVSGEGAAEIAVGDAITGLFELPGEALGVATRNKTQAIVGASSATFSLNLVSPDTGAVADTVQSLGQTYALDDRGVIRVRPTQEYGNFAANTVSDHVQDLIDGVRGKAVTSVINRSGNLVRWFMNDKRVLVMLPGRLNAFTVLSLAHQPTCAWSGEDSTGAERTFFGADDGYVYELDRGSSFDGEPIAAWIRIWYYHVKSPRVRKAFKRGALECSMALYSPAQVRFEFDYGSTLVGMPMARAIALTGGGALWGAGNWGEFVWGAQDVSQPVVDIGGTGSNFSMTVYSNTDIDLGHTFQGLLYHYLPRRIER